MNPLASTTFATGPKDTLAAVDVYGADGGIVNSIQDAKTSSSFDISSILANAGKGGVTSLTSLLAVNQKTGGVSLNLTQVTAKVNQSIPQLGSSVRNLSDSAKSTLTSSYQDFGDMKVNMGGSVFSVPSSKSADLYGYSDYVNDVNAYGTGLSSETVPGMCSIYDEDSHSSLISAGILQGSNIGLPNAVTTLTTPVAVIGSASLMTKVTQSCLPILAKNGDLGNLAALSGTKGAQVFDAVLPNYANVLTAGYSGQSNGRNGGAAVNDYQSLITIFTNTNSSWNIFDRIGDVVGQSPTLNLLKLLGGTSAFQNLLAVGVKNLLTSDKGHILATMFSKTDVITQLHNDFPKLILEADFNKTTKRARVIDPRVLSLIGTSAKTISGNISI